MKVLRSKKLAVSALQGFACGLPFALTGSGGTLQAWLTEEKLNLSAIGAFTLIGLPASFKFLWAPLVDRYFPKNFTKSWGRRKTWLLFSQLCLMLGLVLMGSMKPSESTSIFGIFALIVAFMSATQDIVVDAHRTEVFTADEVASGQSVYVMGYRIAMLVSGALALILADHMSWQGVYYTMAACLGLGILSTCMAEEPAIHRIPKNLQDAFIQPLLDFFKRSAAFEVLLFLVLYKLDTFISIAFRTTFLLNVGYTKTQIGTVGKTVGLTAAIVGSLLGGFLLIKRDHQKAPTLSLKQALMIFGVLQGTSNLLFCWIASTPVELSTLVVAQGCDDFIGAMGNVAYAALVTSLCNRSFTATQYALFSSLMAVPRAFSGLLSGALANFLGISLTAPIEISKPLWNEYFFISVFCAIPGLLLLTRFQKWVRPNS